MEMSLVLIISLSVLVVLVFLAVETVREFKKMDKRPQDYTGSDRLAGSAE
ncbi:MAG: hypothetical protein JWP91_3197 [Fibrobacteres bacterium]|nr:hypothetical protein [Fibrobacterota bacterium]